jgi:hypothetical protein
METAYTALAAGRGDSAMIRLLQEAQQSKHTMLPHSVKLCCLLDIVPLAESGAEEVHAAWRQDPQSTGGLLQGIYAHLLGNLIVGLEIQA